MSDQPVSLAPTPEGYADWLRDLKTRIHSAQQRAALAVNRELVLLYWQIGRDILARQASQGWGSKVIERLAHDLRTAFPDMKGFSRANLMYMRAFAEAWPDAEVVQQAVGQIHRTATPVQTRACTSGWHAKTPSSAERPCASHAPAAQSPWPPNLGWPAAPECRARSASRATPARGSPPAPHAAGPCGCGFSVRPASRRNRPGAVSAKWVYWAYHIITSSY